MRLAGDRSYGPRQVLRDGPPQPERMTSTVGQWLSRPEIGGHTRRQQVMPLSHGSRVADAGAARLGAGPGLARPPDVPQLNPGVEQLGEYQGSGLTGATYLIRNARGQVVQVSGLLNLVLTGIDGRRTVSAIAARVSAASGRPVSADNVEYLLAHKLGPLDLLIPGDGARDHAAARPDPAVLVLRLRRTLVPEAAVGQAVVDQTAQKRDIGPGADLHEAIGHRGGALKPRIHRHQLRVAVALGLHHPAESHRVILCRIASHRQRSEERRV